MLTAAQFSAMLPSHPVLSSSSHRWGDVSLDRYLHPPSEIDVPGLERHLLVVHMRGPLAVEEREDGRHWERRWSDVGQVSVTPAAMPVARRFTGRPDVLVMQIGPTFMDGVMEDVTERDPRSLSLIPCFARPDACIDQLVRLLALEAEQAGDVPGSELLVGSLAHAVAVQLLRGHSTLSPTPAPTSPTLPPGRLRRVIEFMREEGNGRSSLDELAAICGLSASHFARAFRTATGFSPHQYLIGLRLQRAKVLLESTELPVIEVAMTCGFEQPSHFATTFRKHVGVSPRAWRVDRRN